MAYRREWLHGPKKDDCEMKSFMGKCLDGALMEIALKEADKQPCRGRVLLANKYFGCGLVLTTKKSSSKHRVVLNCMFDTSSIPHTRPPG
ncbi:hypothetical protein OSTOST_22075 [Ostertagia ostertagi]